MPMTGEQEEKLDDLLLAIDGEHGVNARLKDLKDSARTRTIVLVAAITVALAVAVVASGVGFKAANDLRTSKAATQRARVASCHQFNVQQKAQANAETVEIRAVVFAIVAGDRSAETTHRVEQFYLKYDRLIAESHPLRDCTAAGINRYLGLTARQP